MPYLTLPLNKQISCIAKLGGAACFLVRKYPPNCYIPYNQDMYQTKLRLFIYGKRWKSISISILPENRLAQNLMVNHHVHQNKISHEVS